MFSSLSITNFSVSCKNTLIYPRQQCKLEQHWVNIGTTLPTLGQHGANVLLTLLFGKVSLQMWWKNWLTYKSIYISVVMYKIDQPHKSHNVLVPCPTIHHSAHFCSNVEYCGKWDRCIVGFLRLVYLPKSKIYEVTVWPTWVWQNTGGPHILMPWTLLSRLFWQVLPWQSIMF